MSDELELPDLSAGADKAIRIKELLEFHQKLSGRSEYLFKFAPATKEDLLRDLGVLLEDLARELHADLESQPDP